MQWGVDVGKAFGGQHGKTRAPIQGLCIRRGFFVFGSPHPLPRAGSAADADLFTCTHGVERMELLQRLLDKIDRFELLIAGLVGASSRAGGTKTIWPTGVLG